VKEELLDIGEYLKSKGVRPSEQRIRIFKYLYVNKNHPTVDMIYRELVQKMPCLSKTTVYNTLNIFLKNNVVRQLAIEENESRYDAIINLHGHFKCEKCENIYDFDIEKTNNEYEDLKKYEINEKYILFKGICPSCLKSSK
jgi:Fe2+ or Zn2+ uptake regulation protein